MCVRHIPGQRGGGVGADADEERVAQRHLAGVPGDEVQPIAPIEAAKASAKSCSQLSSSRNGTARATTRMRDDHAQRFAGVLSSAMSPP
jgi:hypothetical protein